MIEDEVQWPADVGVRVAQPGDHRRAVQVDDARRTGVEVEALRRHRDDPVALDEDVAPRRPLGRVPGAGQDHPVAEKCAICHLCPPTGSARSIGAGPW